MPYQIQPQIPLYCQNLSETLEILLPPFEELSLPREDEVFKNIGDIENENKFQFPNPTSESISLVPCKIY